jgi:hypothetical protein
VVIHNCLSDDPKTRRKGFSILQAHPDSRGLKITTKFAREFLMDDDVKTAKSALFILGYGIGRKRWSWNPNNQEEEQIIGYAQVLCHDLTEAEIRRAVELVDNEYFGGPDGLGGKGVSMCLIVPKMLQQS